MRIPRAYLWAIAAALVLAGVLALVGRSVREIVGVVIIVVVVGLLAGAEVRR